MREVCEGGSPVTLTTQTRADCVNAPRPCVFVSCKYNLYLDVTEAGSLKINFPDKELHELSETCALDVADRGGSTLELTGSLMNMTRERIRQIEESSTRSMSFEMIDFQPLPAKEKLPISPERREQLRRAKKKYRQGNGRENTNAARRRAYERTGK